jgi:hypothetical protein
VTLTWPRLRLVGRWATALLIAGFSALFALFLSVAAWPVAGALFIIVAAVVMLITGFERLSLVWVVGIPSVFTYANNVGSVLPLFTVERLLFVVLLGMLIAGTALGVRKAGRLDRIEKTSMLFLALMLLSMVLLWTTVSAQNWRADGAFWLTGYVMPLGAYAIARRIEWTEAKVRWLLLAILCNAAFLALVGLLQYLFDFRSLNATYMETQHADESYVRGIGTFGASWEYGAVSAVFVLIGFFLLTTVRDAARRLGIVALMVAALVSLFISLTRAPMLALGVGVAAMALLDRPIRRISVPVMVLGAFGLLLALPLLLSSESVMDRLTELSPIYNRLALYVTSVNMGLQNLLFGVGFGERAFVHAAPDYMVSFGPVQANWMLGVAVPHNEFLHVWVTCGLPALILFALIFLMATHGAVRRARDPQGSPFSRRLAALVFGVLVVHLLVMNTLDTGFARYFSLLTFFMAGMSEALSRTRKQEGSASSGAAPAGRRS